MHTPNTAPQPGPCRPLCNVIITSCSAAPPGNCSGPHKFQCGSGECRPISYRCNGYKNCADGSDEKNCGKLMVIVTVVVVVVVVQSNTLKSNVLVNFFFLRVLRFFDLPVHDWQMLKKKEKEKKRKKKEKKKEKNFFLLLTTAWSFSICGHESRRFVSLVVAMSREVLY